MSYSDRYSQLNLSQEFISVLKLLENYRLFPFILELIENLHYYSSGVEVTLQGKVFIVNREILDSQIRIVNDALLIYFFYEVDSQPFTLSIQVSKEGIRLFTNEDFINSIKLSAIPLDRIEFNVAGRIAFITESLPGLP